MKTFETSKALQKAHDLFGVKSFADEFAGLKDACKWVSWPLSLFSIITGYGFLYYLFVASMPATIATVCAVVLLGIVEVLKRYVGRLAFTNYYKEKGMFTAALTIATGALMVLSIYMSVLGAAELVNETSVKLERIESSYLNTKDSIEKHYANLIGAEKKALEDYTRSVSWKGNVDVSNKATQATILRHTQRIQSLENESLKILEISRKNKETTTLRATQETYQDATMWSIIAGIVEVAIMLTVWFVIYYYYIVKLEHERELYEATNGTMKTINVGADNGIIQGLLDDLKGGINQVNFLCKKHGVNPSIVKKHKEILNA